MKTTRSSWVTLSLVLLFLLAISSSTYQLIVKKCVWWTCAPVRSFTVYDLSLPNEFFPGDNGMSPLYPDRGIIEAVEEVRSTASWKGGGAIYKVLRFGTEKQATEWYSVEVGLDLFTDSPINLPDFSGLTLYKNSVPDESKVNCGFVLEDFRCVYWARYHEFFIFFSSSIDNDELRTDDFIQILDYINERVESLLM